MTGQRSIGARHKNNVNLRNVVQDFYRRLERP